MTDERYNALMDHIEQDLHAEEIAEGWHFCWEWDGLLIAPHMGEWECCTCFEPGQKLAYTGPPFNEAVFPDDPLGPGATIPIPP